MDPNRRGYLSPTTQMRALKEKLLRGGPLTGELSSIHNTYPEGIYPRPPRPMILQWGQAPSEAWYELSRQRDEWDAEHGVKRKRTWLRTLTTSQSKKKRVLFPGNRRVSA